MSAPAIPKAALAQHIAILGKTGAGKTYAAKGAIVEPLLAARERVCVLDPTGVYWGLRLAPDGKRPSGFDVVIVGGRKGDLPLRGDAGDRLAEVVGGSATPVVVDTSQLGSADRGRFFTDFADGLLKHNEGPLHLVIDEAHLFMPQGRTDVQGGMMVHAGTNLVALGRARGLRITLLSQRPAKLHKDALTQVETLVALRVIHNLDRKAIEDWIAGAGDKAGAEVVASLASLPRGEGWVWSPDLGVLERVQFPAISTFDSGAAPDNANRGPKLAPIDVAAIRAAFEAPATEPAGAKGKAAAPDPAALAAAEARGYARGLAEGERRGEARGFELGLERARAALAALRSDALAEPAHLAAVPAARPAASPRAAPRPPQAAGFEGAVSRPRQAILDAIAWMASIGERAPAKAVVAYLSGASSTSGAYANNLSALRTAGLVDYPAGGCVALTDAGRRQAAKPEGAPTHEAMLAKVAEHLSGPQGRILGALCAAHPRALSKEALAARVDASATSGAFANNLSRLRTLGLINYPAPGQAQAADLMFPGQRVAA